MTDTEDAAHQAAVDEYEAARADRVDRYRQYGQNAAARSATAMAREHAIAGMIPAGQPLLVGHGSEGHHRRDMKRIDSLIRKAIEEDSKAAYWQRKAAAVASDRTVRSDDPDAVRKLQAKLAGLEGQRERRKAINKQLKAGATLDSLAPTLTAHERNELAVVEQMFRGRRTRYDLTNVGAEIRRVKERITALEGGE